MAEIRQGYLDDFTQNTSGNIGIGTTSASDAKLEIVGGTTTQELNITGIATFAASSGFVKKHTNYTENIQITNGDSGTLSGEVVVGTGLTMTVGTSVTSSQGSIQSLKVSNMFQPPSGTTATRPSAKPGSLFYNFDLKTIEFFDGNSWRQVDNTTRSSRAVIYQGYQPSYYPDMIDFIQITTLGNSQNFGDQNGGVARDRHGCGSNIRGVFGAGIHPNGGRYDAIEYVALASGGKAADFGDLTNGMGHGTSCSSSTRGLFGGGYQPSLSNTINYLQIQTSGNALDFGDLQLATGYLGSGASPTRGIFCGGAYNAPNDLASDRTEFFNFASKGDGTDFGGLTSGRFRPTSCGAYLSVFSFGSNAGNSGQVRGIDQTNTNSLGKSLHFGELTMGDLGMGFAAGNNTRVVVGGGQGGGTSPAFQQNRIEYITISTNGNSQDFGDMTTATVFCNATSDSHGGLGGF